MDTSNDGRSVVAKIVGLVLGVLFVLAVLALVNGLADQPRWCEGINPKTGVKECRMLRELMGETQCPAEYVEVPSCTIPSGTVDVAPVPTEPPEDPGDPPEIPTPTVTPPPTQTPASSDPVSISMPLTLPLVITLPVEGYEVELYCAPRACWIDAMEPNWKLRGPFKVTVRQIP